MAQTRNSGGTRRVRTSERPPVQKASGRRPAPQHKAPQKKQAARPASKAISKAAGVKDKFLNMGEMDYTLLFLIILVVVVGLIVLLSASAPSGKRIYDDSYYYFKRQLFFVVVGFVGMIIISTLELEKYIQYVPKAFIACFIMLVLVLIPGIGMEVNGARRWFNLGFMQLQPSEFMKPVIAMYIAYLVHIQLIDLRKLKSNMACAGIVGAVALLLMLETHLSGTLVIVGIAVCVMIAGGTPIKPLALGIGVVALIFVIYLMFDEVRMARVTSLFDPFADPQGTGYQISQSIYAIGSGRIFGLGLGESVQKYSNLPEPYNDFIFSIVCEELGFVGATIIVMLFVALFLRAMRVAVNAPDAWSSLVCVGIASQIGIQTVLNMGVAISLIPNTGVSLPFFSYGGTSVMTLLLEMGILLNVSRRAVK
ncbi:MAG: putative lipid II flippase FtsW [Clostridia bacterium]|nr:putative lipid II flippase FtsW [Clostridia bacterium]